MSSNKVVLIIVVILVLGVGGYLVFHKKANNSPATTNSTAQKGTSSDSSPVVAATITYTDSGFTPALTTVKAGDTVKVVNNSSNPLQLDSNPHPAHTDEPELNVGEIDAGKSATFTITQKGTWGFHNHLQPGDTGKIEVQ
ncbi:MAG TPA: cupredoxin domain-containing protein [Candidatus Saccharimonadales bacterium]|nr:cupredoxin domain-containing protein [Candidatus Saccharimonadales bacterium]